MLGESGNAKNEGRTMFRVVGGLRNPVVPHAPFDDFFHFSLV